MRRLLACPVALLLGGLLVLACGPGMEDRAREQLRPELQAYQGEHADVLRRLYEKSGDQLLWVDGRGPTAPAYRLMEALCKARMEGLDPGPDDLHRISEEVAVAFGPEDRPMEERAQAMLQVDFRLSHALLVLLEQQRNGRTSPEDLLETWHIAPDRSLKMDNLIEHVDPRYLAATADLDQMKKALHPAYTRLAEALERYGRIAEDGGWPGVPGRETLRRGSRGQPVVALRQRLAAEDDLPTDAQGDPVFDEELERAVMRFQARHGFEADGVVGDKARAALNVPVAERIQQMQVNLERYRWLPDRWEDERIVINIPEFTLRAYREGRQELEMAVVVGERMNQTPVFRDTMTYVVVRPTWNIPAAIAVEEILPELEKDPLYLQRKNYEIVDADGTVTQARFRAGPFRRWVVGSAPAEEELSDATPDLGRASTASTPPSRGDDLPTLDAEALETHALMLRQRPGPDNALGRIKFMLPNDFDIYLHDTPESHLFAASRRDFSHGCIRVEDPLALAVWTLSDQEEWTAATIQQEMSKDEPPREIPLTRGIPVTILYLTAWADGGGRVHFRKDVYSLDAQQARSSPDGETLQQEISRCQALVQTMREARR